MAVDRTMKLYQFPLAKQGVINSGLKLYRFDSFKSKKRLLLLAIKKYSQKKKKKESISKYWELLAQAKTKNLVVRRAKLNHLFFMSFLI